MNRTDKLKRLKDKQDKKDSQKLVLTDGKPFIEAFEFKVKQLIHSLDGGVDINSVDILLKELAQIGALKKDVDKLTASIKQVVIPNSIKIDGLPSLLKALKAVADKKELTVKPIDIKPINNITTQVERLTKKIDTLKVPRQGQKPSDYIPMRRVMLVGKTLMYDDSFYTGGGGGGGGISLIELQTIVPDQAGTWGYSSGTNGTLVLSGGKRVLQITAIAQEASASLSINGGNTITLPYGSTDKVSSAITIEPKGNLVDPTIVFSAGVDSYFCEWVI